MPKRILVVDDEPDIVSLIKMRLEAQGHSVIPAYNGREALEKLQDDLPNLIISDVMMPDMDGVDLYIQLKKDGRTKNIPILILTARETTEKYFRQLKINEFISKPFKAEDLVAKVDRLLNAPENQVVVPEKKGSQSAVAKQEKKPLISDELRIILIVVAAIGTILVLLFGLDSLKEMFLPFLDDRDKLMIEQPQQ